MIRNLFAGNKKSGGFSLNILTDDELEDIHLATLEVLKDTGVYVQDVKALDVYGSGGAKVDKANKIVKIPPHVVEDAIASAPSTVTLAGRDPKHDVLLEKNRVGFTNFGEGIIVVDPDTEELRETTKKDVAQSAVIINYLSEIDVYERAMGAHESHRRSSHCTMPRPFSQTLPNTASIDMETAF